MTVAVIPVPGVPMVQPGDDLAALLGDAIESARVGVKAHDIVVVCQKVVSKAEGAVVDLNDVEPSAFAEQLAARTTLGKDPRAYEVVLRETDRIVRMDRGHLIVETRHGWVCANAGVDESNGLAPGVLTLLPRDADASAEGLRSRLAERFGVELAVVVTDTFGRPWREGLVEVALGCAGMDPLLDLRGPRRSARQGAPPHGGRPRRRGGRGCRPGHGEGQRGRGRDRARRSLHARDGRAPRPGWSASPSSTSSGDRRPGRGALSSHPGVA